MNELERVEGLINVGLEHTETKANQNKINIQFI